MFRIVTLWGLVMVGGLCSSLVVDAEEGGWHQWRGPGRNSQIADDTSWPEKLAGDALEELWRVLLGPSYSGPIVTADRVFVTETRDRKYEVVRALRREDGKELWKAEWEGAISVPFFAKANGDWIRSTPAYDDGRLYVAGMRDLLVCLDAESGKELWRYDFVAELGTPVPDFGFVCSPLVAGEFVYVQAGGCFAKLDKRTGEVVWRTLNDKGGMLGSAFSSPVLETVAGKEQLLVQTRTTLAGVDPADGKVLWSEEIPAFRGMNILTPTRVGDRLFTSAYGGRSFLFEFKSGEEKPQLDQVWENKVQGYMSSPVVIDGYIYLHLRNQRFTCIDAATGEEKWTTRPYGKYWSMVASGDKILALDERGDLMLIRANPKEFELLDTRKVADDAWAHLAIDGNQIFIRDLGALIVYQWGK